MKQPGLGLKREAIVQKALVLLNEVGMESVTTRKLAERLGIKSSSLYWHFKNKRDLFNAMAQAMLSPDDRSLLQGDWRVWMANEARTFRKDLLAYRDGARVHSGTRPSENDYSQLEKEVVFLCEAGFKPDDALRALVTISYFVIGWVLEEQAASEIARGQSQPAPSPDPAAYPKLALAQSVLGQDNPDDDFEFGLCALITGLGGAHRKGLG